jgi:pimeloyl-ACP methyl ester carboxylesterase
MKHLGKTRPFLGPDGAPLPNSIAEIKYLQLGGIEQWVMIRGENFANPLLTLLHGGPGMSEMRFFRCYNGSLEKKFTVVYWDQRGAGKSFNSNIPKSSMTVKQFIADLGALIDAVCARVGQSRVVIFGHSWGSVLGQLYAARFPTKVAAYVGSGQIGDWQAGELASYQWALAEAQRTKNANALKELRAIGSPPHSVSNLWTERTWLQRFAGQFKAKALWKKKWDERYSADRNHLSSIYPTFCAASTSHLTLCGLKCLC